MIFLRTKLEKGEADMMVMAFTGLMLCVLGIIVATVTPSITQDWYDSIDKAFSSIEEKQGENTSSNNIEEKANTNKEKEKTSPTFDGQGFVAD